MSIGRIGVCSWSLRPEGPAALADLSLGAGVRCIQLALGPLVAAADGAWREAPSVLRHRGLTLLSGMLAFPGEDYSTLQAIARTGGVRPDATWDSNLALARATAQCASNLGLRLVTFHAGFLPHEAGAERSRMIARLREVHGAFAAFGISTALETGQESAETLEAALRELAMPELGVNFDPANMILYGMGDPVRSIERLAPHVRQVHIKDARRAPKAGEWGSEVPVGKGEVDWDAFLRVVRALPQKVDLVIEREAGAARAGDVAAAVRFLSERGC